MRTLPLTALLLLTLAIAPLAQEDAPAPDAAPDEKALQAAFEAGLTFKQGDVVLRDGLATAAIGEQFRYLGPTEAAALLEAWGNPPGAETLGILLPKSGSVFADETWAIVITYEEDGHVEDDDAGSIDYDELLAEMRSGMKSENDARRKAGYETIELVGWATPPRYDASAKKLYWAKELKFAGAEENTLNYNIRVLGRRGVLVLNVVGTMSQLKAIEAVVPRVLAVVDFNEGHRYADFDSNVDEVAAYGIGGLIAGKVAAKVGLFKGIWLAILAAKKFVIIGVLALGAVLFRFFGRKKATPTTE